MPQARACKRKPRTTEQERFLELYAETLRLQEEINRTISLLLGRPVVVEGLLPRR